MESIKKKGLEKKTLYFICALCLASLYALLVFLLEPLYFRAVSNVAASGFLSELLYYLCVAIELLAVFVSYAVAIYGIGKFGAKNFRGAILVFILASLIKYCLKAAVIWSYTGAVPSLWYMDIIDAVYFAALEIVQFFIVWAIVKRVLSGRMQENDEMAFSKLYDGKNRFMRASLYSAIVVSAARLILQITNDVATIVMYGLPTRIETPILMVVSYLATLIFGAICYLVTVIVLSRLSKKDRAES